MSFFPPQTNIGPILLTVNPYADVGNPLTLNSMRSVALNEKLRRVVRDAVRQQSETGYPQAIILSGEYAGSGSKLAPVIFFFILPRMMWSEEN